MKYIGLVRYTEQGVQNIKDSPDRLDAVRDMYETMGAELQEFYLTFGEYDIVTIAEAPDDVTAAQLSLATSSRGNVTIETLKAFEEDEYRDVIDDMP